MRSLGGWRRRRIGITLRRFKAGITPVCHFPLTELQHWLTCPDIKHLMISPNHQNQRIGTALLNAVLRESDKAGFPTVLVSSAEAMALYRRAGFKELLTWRIDNEAWAKRIVERMREEGLEDGEGLVRMYRGVEEVETYMVRWSEGRDGGDVR